VGRLAHGLPPPNGRRSVAADVPASLAQRLQRSRPNDMSHGVSAAGVPPRQRSGRLARRPSRGDHLNAFGIQRPGSGLGGCPGWRSGRASTERSDMRARPDRQAGVGPAQQDGRSSTRSPGTGEGRSVSQPALPA